MSTPPPPPPLQPSQPATVQVASQEMYNYAAQLLINQKQSADVVRNALMQKGLPMQEANTVVNALLVEINKQKKIRARRDMAIGGVVCVIGIIVTAVTYSIASSGSSGGTYYVAWGAILFGAIQFFKGLFNSMK